MTSSPGPDIPPVSIDVPPVLETCIHSLDDMRDAVRSNPEAFADYISVISDIESE